MNKRQRTIKRRKAKALKIKKKLKAIKYAKKYKPRIYEFRDIDNSGVETLVEVIRGDKLHQTKSRKFKI